MPRPAPSARAFSTSSRRPRCATLGPTRSWWRSGAASRSGTSARVRACGPRRDSCRSGPRSWRSTLASTTAPCRSLAKRAPSSTSTHGRGGPRAPGSRRSSTMPSACASRSATSSWLASTTSWSGFVARSSPPPSARATTARSRASLAPRRSRCRSARCCTTTGACSGARPGGPDSMSSPRKGSTRPFSWALLPRGLCTAACTTLRRVWQRESRLKALSRAPGLCAGRRVLPSLPAIDSAT
mmetsp:Transcript_12720/g.32500  ORF Transcript_12720/g.32500 Transcript_12720/m.32500 type:complete len:241 (+) Transcript_12720:312-1034(+)